MKVNGLNEVSKLVDKENLRNRIEKEFINSKVDEMVENGVDKEMAKVMAKAFFECGVYN